MTRTEMDGQITLLLFYEGRRQAVIKDVEFCQRRAEESIRCGLLEQAKVEQGEAALWQLDADKWQQHINDIKARLMEICHD